MKKILFSFIGILFIASSHAVDLTLVSYDDNMYYIIDPAYASAGELTLISDIYYYYKPFEHTLILKQTEWIGDGQGQEYIAPYSPSEFFYSGITFENFDKEIGLENDEIVLQNIADLKNQFEVWVSENITENILRDFLVNETTFLENQFNNRVLNNVSEDWVKDFLLNDKYFSNLEYKIYKQVSDDVGLADWLKQYLLNEVYFYDLDTVFYNKVANNIDFNKIFNSYYDFELLLGSYINDNISEFVDVSILSVSKNIVKQHNVDVYNSVFGNAKLDEKKFSVWGTTLFNSMNKSGKYDYSTNGLSVVLGADLQLSDTVLVGMGYSYSNTDVDISPSDILFDNSSLFLYSKWKPSKFYLNAIVSYGFADYEYVDSDFNNGDVSGLFASVMAGYNTDSGISPEIGIRYTNLEINHNSEYLKKSESDFSSALAGLKYERALGKFVLGGHVMVEYDIIQPDGDIDIDVLGYKYDLTIEDNERPLGVEFGLLASYNINDVDLQLKYDMRLRSDFVNHTGVLSIKYAF